MRFIFSLFALLPAVFTAPIEKQQAAGSDADRWIVRVPTLSLVDTVVASISTILGIDDLNIFSRYHFGNFYGFAFEGSATPTEVLLIQALAGVTAVEQDKIMSIDALKSQKRAPSYGLARISSRKPGPKNYLYDDSAGVGTYSYIIDTVSKMLLRGFRRYSSML